MTLSIMTYINRKKKGIIWFVYSKFLLNEPRNEPLKGKKILSIACWPPMWTKKKRAGLLKDLGACR